MELLEEALAEGILTGHPDMPEFAFPPEDIGAIIAYLRAVQEVKRPDPSAKGVKDKRPETKTQERKAQDRKQDAPIQDRKAQEPQ